MREAKYRAWDNVDMKMYYLGEEDNIHFYFDSNGIVAERFYNEEICTPEGERDFYGNSEKLEHLKYLEYTGLKDKNSVEIYEADKVKGYYDEYDSYFEETVRHHFLSDVKYIDNSFKVHRNTVNDEGRIRDYGYQHEWDNETVEVVGNIYENPELPSNSSTSKTQ